MEWTTILPYAGPSVAGVVITLAAIRHFIIRPFREENTAWRDALAEENMAYRNLVTNHMSGMTAAQHDTAAILRDLVAGVSKINGKLG